VIGALTVLVIAAVYAFAAISYRASIQAPTPATTAPPGGLAAVFVPQTVLDTGQQVAGYVLVYPAADLLGADGTLRHDITLTVAPAVGTGTLVFHQGQTPTPQYLTLPAPGIVEQYPFDTYQVASTVSAVTSAGSVLAPQHLPVAGSLLFRIPGWRVADPTTPSAAVLGATIARSGSTEAIAVMLLILMLALACIAVLVVRATIRGRLPLELTIASWITAMLFALIPIRGFLPGAPPIGSWIDILVFFWVEVALIAVLSVYVVMWILARPADA
jgi:hypothetical protein